MIKTWQKHLTAIFVTNILTTLCMFYGIYIILDVITHIKDITTGKTSFVMWFVYYLAALSKRFDILVPFSILIATIRSLHRFQIRGELIALLASGVSKIRLMLPFIFVTAACTCSILLNYQFFLPQATTIIQQIRDADFSKNVEEQDLAVKQILLDDSSRIIYQSYDPVHQEFTSLFWLKSPTEFYYMKTLSVSQNPPKGSFVDKFERNGVGELKKTHSSKNQLFPEMTITQTAIRDGTTAIQDQSLTQLVQRWIVYSKTHSSRFTEIQAILLYKLTFPLLCFAAFFGPAPYLLRFGRIVPIFTIYLTSIALLFCLDVLLQALYVIAKNGLLSASIVILIPWLLIAYLLIKRFIKSA